MVLSGGDATYWVYGGNLEDLNEVIRTKASDPDKGIAYFEHTVNEEIGFRSCSSGLPDVTFEETQTISNGNQNGSSKLVSRLLFNYYTLPIQDDIGIFYVKVFLSLWGTSQRKSNNQWRNYRADHHFSWDFKVKKQQFITTSQGTIPGRFTITSHAGSDIHLNNRVAARDVVVFGTELDGYYYTQEFIDEYRFFLEEVTDGSDAEPGQGTFHSTNYLLPQVAAYSCN